MNIYDVIVVGAGHAGTESALAASRMGCSVLLVTMSRDTLGHLSCNPAIGGVGKGQLVKEIDALGGEIARAADSCGIQFRRLNSSKGPAVRSSRVQIDRKKYKAYIKNVLENQSNLKLKDGQVAKILIENNIVKGIELTNNEKFFSKCVVITPGTFLNGVIHIGLKHQAGGRINEEASVELSNFLKDLGFNILRFKTGTCSRLDGRTIDFSKLQIQEGDKDVLPFSFSTREIKIKQVPCYITYTNKNTHEIILKNLDRSPLYSGKIKATGVRYCPSIEDKVVKFSERTRHQIFLEPEGLTTHEYYPNGLSTSLPLDVQEKILHSIVGLESVLITKPGYGIEHDVIDSTQLYPTLESKLIKNLFFAGQINGTTGYEEAATQGLIAGINASLKVKEKQPFILDRSISYIGVLIDDLTTKGTNEPYRMFTSRVEYRLILREDNADLRLTKFGYELGLISKIGYEKVLEKQKNIEKELSRIRKNKIMPTTRTNEILTSFNTACIRKPTTLEELLKRPEMIYEALMKFNHCPLNLSKQEIEQVEIEAKYKGFIQRQFNEVEKFKHLEKIKIPQNLDYEEIPGISREIKEKLTKLKPISLGQASRISGITPASISLLMVWLRKKEIDAKI